MKIKTLFAWYDFWIGIYWERASRKLYILPVPCLGVVIEFFDPKRHCDSCRVELDPKPFKCVIFTSSLTSNDIAGVRCYPCDDKITDAMLEGDQS